MHFKDSSRAILGLVVLGLALAGSDAQAIPVYGTDASGELVGSRVERNGITVGGDYNEEPLSTVGWSIAPLGGGQYSYTYSFSGFSGPDISLFILDLTDDCVGPPVLGGCVTGVDPDVPLEYGDFGPGPSNPGFPLVASLVGVKFDDLPDDMLRIFFESNRAPVYGDFYLKGGVDSFAHNDGLDNHTSENIMDFIARPNGVAPIPEPGTVLLLGSGLLGLALKRRRAR